MSSIIGLEVHALNHDRERRDIITKAVSDFFVNNVGVGIKLPYTNENSYILAAFIFKETRIPVTVMFTGRFERVVVIREL